MRKVRAGWSRGELSSKIENWRFNEDLGDHATTRSVSLFMSTQPFCRLPGRHARIHVGTFRALSKHNRLCERSQLNRVRHTRRSRQYVASPCCFPRAAEFSATRCAECDELSSVQVFRPRSG